MATIYIVGPVPRSGATGQALHDFYGLVERELASFGWAAAPPRSEGELQRMSPEVFAREIFQRIKDSDGMVTVLAEGDQSAPVEATFGAVNGKKQLIVADSPERVPRIIRGLPNVIGVVSHLNTTDVRRGVAQLCGRDL